MSDSESSTLGGTKRKHKENAFTAKAESGTLKVKILRRDQRAADLGIEALVSSSTSSTSSTTKTRPRRARQPPPSADSPPKPRPNRKHVPIFYQQAHLDQVKKANAHSQSSSTDESAASHSSTTGVAGIHSTSSTDIGAASTSSTTSSQLAGRFSAQLSTSGDLGLPPTANPLFSRNDSDGVGSVGDLLRSYLPSSSGGLSSSFPLLGTQAVGTASSAGLLLDQTGPSSALHQLASSSASYRSALDALSSTGYAAAASGSASTSSTAVSTDAALSTASTNGAQAPNNGGLGNYRFDPLTALQSAIEQAGRVSSGIKESAPATTHSDGSCEVGSPNGKSRYFRLEPSGSSETVGSNANSLTTTNMDPPALPPSFAQQNSLIGGGIHTMNPLKLRSDVDGNNSVDSSSSSKGHNGDDTVTTLGPPPDAPPSFLLQNSLVGGGISQPKSNFSLSRLCSVTSVTSEGGENNTGIHLSGLHTSTQYAGSTTTAATGGTTTSSETEDLGPPPSGPPAFTIGNSLMGGGIELQPAATHVNTHNFDWKLHKSASTSGEDGSTSPASRLGLRVRYDSGSRATPHPNDEHQS